MLSISFSLWKPRGRVSTGPFCNAEFQPGPGSVFNWAIASATTLSHHLNSLWALHAQGNTLLPFSKGNIFYTFKSENRRILYNGMESCSCDYMLHRNSLCTVHINIIANFISCSNQRELPSMFKIKHLRSKSNPPKQFTRTRIYRYWYIPSSPDLTHNCCKWNWDEWRVRWKWISASSCRRTIWFPATEPRNGSISQSGTIQSCLD